MLPITEKTSQDISSPDATHTKQTQLRDRNTANFKKLEPGQHVLAQHHIAKEWTISATITAARQDWYSYVLVTDEGKTLIRGQRLLKAISNDSSDPHDTNTEHSTTSSRATNLTNNYQLPLPPKLSPCTPHEMPRRSPRLNKEQQQHRANRLYVHPNSRGNVQPGFFR